MLHVSAAFVRSVLACLAAALLMCACSSSDQPPYYTAIVTDVYKQEFTVEHFTFLYWWQERGETPFLKPYDLAAKEFICEVMQPIPNAPGRVTVETARIPFDNLDTISIQLTDAGKQMLLTTKDGRRLSPEMNFPKTLKKETDTGVADWKIFVQGQTAGDGAQKQFKLGLEFVKQIRIIKKTGP